VQVVLHNGPHDGHAEALRTGRIEVGWQAAAVIADGKLELRGPAAHHDLDRTLGSRLEGVLEGVMHELGDRQRQLSWAVNDGPYLIMSAAGYADGRPRVPLSSDSYAAQEMTSVADGVAEAVALPLGALPATPSCPGIPGC